MSFSRAGRIAALFTWPKNLMIDASCLDSHLGWFSLLDCIDDADLKREHPASLPPSSPHPALACENRTPPLPASKQPRRHRKKHRGGSGTADPWKPATSSLEPRSGGGYHQQKFLISDKLRNQIEKAHHHIIVDTTIPFTGLIPLGCSLGLGSGLFLLVASQDPLRTHLTPHLSSSSPSFLVPPPPPHLHEHRRHRGGFRLDYLSAPVCFPFSRTTSRKLRIGSACVLIFSSKYVSPVVLSFYTLFLSSMSLPAQVITSHVCLASLSNLGDGIGIVRLASSA